MDDRLFVIKLYHNNYLYAWKSLLHEFESRHIHDQLINVVLVEESYPQIPERKKAISLVLQEKVRVHRERMQSLEGGRQQMRHMYQQARANEMAMRKSVKLCISDTHTSISHTPYSISHTSISHTSISQLLFME